MDLTAVVQTVLVTFLASGASVTVVAFLGKSLVTHWLDKDLDRFRIELTAKLERVAMEHQVRFTRLHEKRTWVIATIYAELEALHAALRQWGTLSATGSDKAAVAAAFKGPATAARDKLAAFYYPRAIWLEREMCDRLNHIIDTLSLLLTVLDMEAKGAPITMQGGGGDSQQLTAELLQIVASARAALEARFRTILGIGNDM
jgi:hypothetical protein